MTLLFEQHKDKNPKNTIEKIQAILDSIGLKKEEAFINSLKVFKNCYSCSLCFKNYPVLRSYGKGITEELALASAYAEYIERLQCFGDNYFNNLGFIIEDEPLFQKKEVNKRELKGFIENLDKSIYESTPEMVRCIPFYNVFEKKIEYLPIELMHKFTISNGMSAGNSFEEAICQSLCEIMERFASSRLFFGEIEGYPTIPLSEVEIQSHYIKQIIKALEAKGIIITLKDCTEGKFPVLAIILEDLKTKKIGINFGADPVFDIALQRCLTEYFQLRKELSSTKNQKEIHLSQDLIPSHHLHLLFEKLMKNKGTLKFKKAFTKPASNRELLQFLLSKLKDHKVYIHDYSWLNFHSYYVYVEGMSKMFKSIVHNQDKILKILFKFPNVSKSEIKIMAALIFENAKTSPESFFESFEKLFNKVPLLSWQNARIFAAFIFIEIDEYEKAQEVLFAPFEERSNALKNIIYEYCLLNGKKNSLSSLKAKFPNSSYNFKHLIDKNYSSFINKSSTPKKFEGLDIPNCLDFSNCLSCYCNKNCFNSSWIAIKEAIKTSMIKIDQSRLFELL